MAQARSPGEGAIAYEIGLMHLHGDEAPKDTGLALLWLERSLEAGFMPAALMLAEVYLEGLGVARDAERAAGFVRQASRQTGDIRIAAAGRAALEGLAR